MPHTLGIFLLSIIFITSICVVIVAEKNTTDKIWKISIGGFITTLLVQLFSIPKEPVNFFRGALRYDSATFSLSIIILIFSILFLLVKKESQKQSIHSLILYTALTFLSILAVQSNRILFSSIVLVGIVITCYGILFNNLSAEEKGLQLQALSKKIFILILFSVILTAVTIFITGQSQFEEVQMQIAKHRDILQNVTILQAFIILGCFIIAGLFPLNGLWGTVKEKASNLDQVFCSGLMGILGIHFFIKYALTMFSTVAIGATEFEPLLRINILENTRYLVSVFLFFIPLIMLNQQKIWGSLGLLLSNVIWVLLYIITLTQKQLFSYVYAALPTLIISLVLLALSMKKLNINWNSKLHDWVGRGRKNSVFAAGAIVSLFSLTFMPPFFMGKMIQNALSVNHPENLILIWNIFLVAVYALRLSVLAFQSPMQLSDVQVEATKHEKIYVNFLISLLIFMGIFHQSLYKYGAYSIKHLFGDY